MKYILGIDMGSSSIKASVIDEEGRVAAKAKVAVEIINPKEGFFEIDPQKIWWGGFKTICDQIKEIIPIQDINAICISSLCGTFVPVDKDFNPTYNAILYSIDTRSSKQVERLNNKYGQEYLTSCLGGIYTTHSTIPKILWVKENLPDIYNKTAYFVESNNFVTAKLTGKVAWDYPTAMGSQMVDVNDLKITQQIINDLGLDGQKIPGFSYITDMLGTVCSEDGKALGFTEGTKVYVGGCDINAEAMAIGTVYPGDMIVVYGTTLSTLFTIDQYSPIKGFRTGMSVLKDTYRLGTASGSGARFIQWMDKLIGVSCDIKLKSLPTGIMVLPYLDGIRSPFDNPKATPVFMGMKNNTSLEDLYVAAREAIGYEIAMIFSMIEEKHTIPDTICCTGGLTNIPEMMQIVANITGKKQSVYTSVDASYGDALVALGSLYSMEEINELPEVKKNRQPNNIVEPQEEIHALYKPLSNRYNKLYYALKDLF